MRSTSGPRPIRGSTLPASALANLGRATFSAPVDLYGAMLYDNQEEYFLWNTGGGRSYYGDVIAQKWNNRIDKLPDQRVMNTYSPAVVNLDYTPLEPGQHYDAPVNGKQMVSVDDVTQYPITILNGSVRHTYVGQEVMGVPAGNLLTCKFSRQPGDGSVQHDWVQHGTGVLVRRMLVDAKGVIRYQHIGDIRPEHVAVLLEELEKAR